MTTKSAPYPPCTVTVSRLKYQDSARCCRRVTQPPFIAGPLGFTLKFPAMIKKLIVTSILISTLGVFSYGQTIEYQAKCREYRNILKYRCAHLILNPDSTFYYEEIAVDLPMVIESGKYRIKGDTLILGTKNYGDIKYLKERNSLMIQDPSDSLYLRKQLRLIVSK
jgi:hypothetical protein